MSVKISVIIPVYNTEQYLSECLDSVINQSLRDIEIIVVNDCSPDDSMSVINAYAQKDPRFVVIDKPKNEGVGKARNDGIAKATGEFVIFMDSDDLYATETALEKLYEAAKAHGVLIAGGRQEKLTEDGIVTLVENPIAEHGLEFYQEGLMRYKDFQYDYGYQCYSFDRRMLLDQQIFFPSYARFQDPPFFVKAMAAADTYYFVDEPIYLYRLLGGSSKYTTKKTMDMLDGVMENLLFSRKQGLAKLHYLSACRLNAEGSFMATHNLFGPERDALLAKLIKANLAPDIGWLKENGFSIEEPFVLDVFKYAVDTAGKYERLRNRQPLKTVRKMLGK